MRFEAARVGGAAADFDHAESSARRTWRELMTRFLEPVEGELTAAWTLSSPHAGERYERPGDAD